MPVSKQQLINDAKKLGLVVEPSMKMADLRLMIKAATDKKPAKETPEVKSENIEDTVAKAGKRSAKAIKGAVDQAAKKIKTEELKTAQAKPAQKPIRSKLERRSKGYKKAAAKLEANKLYALDEAISLAKTTSPVKFDASVELHINLSVDPRQADQNIRDIVVLPAGNGKTLRIATLSDDPKTAQAAGADLAGGDELIAQIDKGVIDFDILIATPNFMPKLGKYARVLGPKGLMPNPKSGTVTNDIKKAITDAKGGRVEYRVDSAGIVHLAIGKVSFETTGLKDNVMAIITSIRANKPSSVKSNYFKAVYLTNTMGPSINVDLASLD